MADLHREYITDSPTGNESEKKKNKKKKIEETPEEKKNLSKKEKSEKKGETTQKKEKKTNTKIVITPKEKLPYKTLNFKKSINKTKNQPIDKDFIINNLLTILTNKLT